MDYVFKKSVTEGLHFMLKNTRSSSDVILEGCSQACKSALYVTSSHISYSLKFSRLKIFVDFAGQSKATKIFSCEIFSSSLMLGVAGSSTVKILSVKICF